MILGEYNEYRELSAKIKMISCNVFIGGIVGCNHFRPACFNENH